ncbi:MAG: protein kinase, partial [Candidatus Hydrogenedentes bacterium]|nr:protein kinase [Candidatus Hydrogenedentota bacterium]
MHPSDREVLPHYDADSIPFDWSKGDLLMEMYDVRGELGRGGMGVVHRVHHRGWGIDVAVKSPKKRLAKKRGWVDTFEHECETWTNLPPHPNTVMCYCVRRLGNVPRVFVEFVDGKDLGRLIKDKGRYEGDTDTVVERILDIAIQVARGLHHAHENGVVHQDVKPKNVLVANSGDVKVTDFGLARVGEIESGDGDSPGKLVRWGPLGGTPVYVSPDYKRLDEVTAQSDIWSLGLSIIEMFSGEIFWQDGLEARTVMETLLRHGARYDEIPVMPPSLLPVLSQCFEEAPEDRPAGMLELAKLLESVHERELGRPYLRHLPEIEVQQYDLMNNRAVSLSELGQKHEAEALWVEIRGADPEHVEARYNLALHQWRHGRISDNEVAAKLYRICVIHEDSWLPKCLLARVLVERGDATTACMIFDELPKSAHRNREVAFGMAISHEWAAKDKMPIWEARAHSSALTAVHASCDGQWVLTGCDGGKIRLWDRSSSTVWQTMSGHDGTVHALVIRASEKSCLSAGEDGFIRIWNSESGTCTGELTGHDGPVRSIDLGESSN